MLIGFNFVNPIHKPHDNFNIRMCSLYFSERCFLDQFRMPQNQDIGSHALNRCHKQLVHFLYAQSLDFQWGVGPCHVAIREIDDHMAVAGKAIGNLSVGGVIGSAAFSMAKICAMKNF